MNSPRLPSLTLLPIAVFFALLPTLSLAGLLDSVESERNLFKNGNFESGKNDWGLVNFGKGGTMTIDKQELHDGKPTLRIESFGELTFAEQTVRVKANTNYRLSGFIKVKDVVEKGGAGRAGANLIEGMTRVATKAINGTADWEEVNVEFNSGNKTEIRVGPAVGWYACKVYGIGWFSDMKLTEVRGERR